jgi:hypothetical protein
MGLVASELRSRAGTGDVHSQLEYLLPGFYGQTIL